MIDMACPVLERPSMQMALAWPRLSSAARLALSLMPPVAAAAAATGASNGRGERALN